MQNPASDITDYYSREGWEYLAAMPVSDLWRFFAGELPTAPSFVNADWHPKGVRPSRFVIVKEGARGGDNPNPRKTGEMGWMLRPDAKLPTRPTPALSEVLHCRGKGTNCSAPNTPRIKREKGCTKAIRWVIFISNLTEVHLYDRGSHGERFGAPANVKVVPYLRQRMLENDNLAWGGYGGATTAMRELRQLQHRAAAQNNLCRLPQHQQVKNILAYERRKQLHIDGSHTQISVLQEIANRPEIEQRTFFPAVHDTSIIERWEAEAAVTIIIGPCYFGEVVQKPYCLSNVGLDAIFKLNKLKWPVFALVTQDEAGHTWPIALALLSNNSGNAIKEFIKKVKDRAEGYVDKWRPTFMIDKDAAEREAVVDTGFDFLLCDFHVQKLWREKVAKLVPEGKRGTDSPLCHIRHITK